MISSAWVVVLSVRTMFLSALIVVLSTGRRSILASGAGGAFIAPADKGLLWTFGILFLGLGAVLFVLRLFSELVNAIRRIKRTQTRRKNALLAVPKKAIIGWFNQPAKLDRLGGLRLRTLSERQHNGSAALEKLACKSKETRAKQSGEILGWFFARGLF